MPNWCSTSYKCVGDLKEVKSLHKILKYIDKRKTTILKNGFGKWWLGNLVHKLGGDWEKYRCRGEITDYFLDGNVLTINQETAWCEQEGLRQIIEEKFPSIKVYFMEEEPGCGVFYTNDSSGEYFPERYFSQSPPSLCTKFPSHHFPKPFFKIVVFLLSMYFKILCSDFTSFRSPTHL